MKKSLGIWFPTIKSGTGADVFTERLVNGLNKQGIKAEITWLPLYAEYAPWIASVPKPPSWATVVHVNTWLHPRFIPGKLPIVATIHHAIHHPHNLPYKGLARATYHKYWIAPIERRVMRRADQLVAVSQFVAQTAIETLANLPIQVIYNGVDIEIFKPGVFSRKPSEPFRLLYIGSWKALKGVDLLSPIIQELGKGFELYYTGGPESKKDKGRMPSNMHDIGRLKGEAAVVSAMQNADALLLPSRSEGHPLVAIEALACGLPVIAMEGSSIGEVVKQDRTGYICKRDDPQDFCKAIKTLFSDKAYLARLGQLARNYAKDSLDTNDVTSQYIEIYRQLHDT